VPADLARFETGGEPDDYRHRMLVNFAALLFLAALIGAGIWLVDAMAQMQRDQNCALAGHHNCTRVDVDPARR
jgi:flagellar biogenesis protein FliO